MRPVTVEVIAYAPTVFRHCQHCEVAFAGVGLAERVHRREAADALPADLLSDYQRVSDWVHTLLDRHAGRVRVRVVDAASLEGVWKSVRYRVRRYPAVVVDGSERLVGGDLAGADRAVERRLAGGSPDQGGRGAA